MTSFSVSSTSLTTTAWLHSRRGLVLSWLAYRPDLQRTKNIWRIAKWKIQQRRPRTQLESSIRQEQDNFPLLAVQQQVCCCYSGEHDPVTTVFQSDAIKFQITLFFPFNWYIFSVLTFDVFSMFYSWQNMDFFSELHFCTVFIPEKNFFLNTDTFWMCRKCWTTDEFLQKAYRGLVH